MTYDPLGPLAHLGPIAMYEQLVEGAAKAHTTLRHLDLSELVGLAEAAEQLARMARHYVERICGECTAPIIWYPNPPAGQRAGWRHVDHYAFLAGGFQHRAAPAHDTTGCPLPDRVEGAAPDGR